MSMKSMIPAAIGLAIALTAPAPMSRAQSPSRQPGAGSRPEGNLVPGPRPRNTRALAVLRGSPTPVLLVKWKAVQKELKVTESQVRKIEAINDGFDRRRKDFVQEMTRAGGRVDNQALMAMIGDARRENEAALAQVLEPRQWKRLDQIALQIEGPLALAKPEIAARVNLWPEQLEEIQTILRQMDESEGRRWQDQLERLGATNPGGDRQAGGKGEDKSRREKRETSQLDQMGQDSDKVREAAIRQIGRVLTRRQRAAFNQMLGAPFDLTRLGPDSTQGRDERPPAGAPTELEPVPAATGPQPPGASGE
jgi:hypothetical protein